MYLEVSNVAFQGQWECRHQASVVVAVLVRLRALRKLHDDADLLVPRIGYRAYEAAK